MQDLGEPMAMMNLNPPLENTWHNEFIQNCTINKNLVQPSILSQIFNQN